MQGTGSGPRTRRFGVFELDVRAAELRKRGVRIKLQEQPFQILCLLLDHSGQLVTRDELRQKLWPAHTFVDFDRSLNKAMAKLRSALGDSAESPRYVETIPRHGYRFLPAVQTHGESGSNGSSEILIQGNGSNGRGVGQSATAAARSAVSSWALHTGRGKKRLYGIAGVAALALLAALTYLRAHPVLGGSVVNPRLSVAVLGFKNLSGDAQEGWLSTALSDWLVTELTAGEQIRAIPAESVARMKVELSLPDVDSLSHDSLVRIRKNLGTACMLAGSYAMFGT